MNYRHHFHAGNFADIFKHLILLAILEKLKNKPSPFCVIDTHAGSGIYDISSEFSLKTNEHLEGISKFFPFKFSNNPDFFENFIKIIDQLNKNNKSENYPGSPYIISSFLREQDRAILMELEEKTFNKLKENNFKKNITIKNIDGIKSLKNLIPPKEKRGLIFIDPAFEKDEEWEIIANEIIKMHKKFPQGIYAIWYPTKNEKKSKNFLRFFTENFIKKIYVSEINLPNLQNSNLKSCGMLIINPPWKLEEKITEIISLFEKAYGEKEVLSQSFWLSNENGEVVTFV